MMKNTNSVQRFERQIQKLECQLALAQDSNLKTRNELNAVNIQYQTAMRRIDYLESVIQKIHALVSEDVTKKLCDG